MEKRYATIEGKVLNVMGRTATDHGSSRGIISSGRGQSSALEIKIDSSSPVKTLIFEGCWPIEKGDYLRAQIDMKEDSEYSFKATYRKKLEEEEKAAIIEKIRGNEVVATYKNGLFS